MAEKLITGPEPSENQESEKSTIEEATHKWQTLKADIEEGRQAIKAKWRSLLGSDLPHAENGQTIKPLPSEIPPRKPDKTISEETDAQIIPQNPASMGEPSGQLTKPILPDKTPIVSQNMPATVGLRAPAEEKNELLPDFHTVQAGETLHGIATKYKINLPFLSEINGIADPSKIEIKQKIALRKGVKIEPEKKELPPMPDFHTVRAGETLYKISIQHTIPLEQLLQLNRLNQNSTLQIGQILVLKPGIKLPEQQEKPKEEKNGAEGLIGKEYTIHKIDEYIQKRTKHSKIKCKINGKMILESASKQEIPPEFLVAILVNDSNLGTKGKGATNNNPGNVGQFDHLDARGITVEGYKTIEEGVDACAENLSRRIRAFQNRYPGIQLDISALVTNVGPDGKGFFKYNIGKDNPKKEGAYMTSVLGQSSVPRITKSLKNDIYPNN